MKKIIDRPVLATIFFVLIIVFGLYSFKNMPIELVPDPGEGLPSLNVRFDWNGASPDMVLKHILIPAEEEIMLIKGVEKLKSRALQNRGTLTVEFNRNTRMNFANVVLKERLNRLKRDMPQQIRGPFISQRLPDEFKQRPLFKIGIYGPNYSLTQLRKISEKEIMPRLKAISGIETVEIFGGSDPEIKIQTLMTRLRKLDIDITQIRNRINQHFFTQQSVAMSKNVGEITLSLSKNPESIDEIRNIIIRDTGGERVYLKDVANVFVGHQELMFERRYQGKPYVQFELYKEPNASHLTTSTRVREKLKYLANKMNGRIEFVIQSNDGKELEYQLMKLSKIAFFILIIILLILLIIIKDFKASLLVFSSVFFSVCATLTCIYLFKIPLNLLTMSGLALGFGLFVDNAVVVFDSILRYRERGEKPRESAILGAQAVILPVLSSTFTTIIVFFSFAIFFQDRLRVYYLPLAYVIAISLLSSIVVSFVLIPSLSARLNLRAKTKENKKLFKKGRFFPFILKYPLTIILPILALFYFSPYKAWEEIPKGEFFSWFNEEKIIVWLRFPAGTEFEEIQRSILGFEQLALE
ncbi:MAG: efflux RND transporter permease subunit, partial [bacterium]|nr:efflux RND transporter permease subunit [bacterium]